MKARTARYLFLVAPLFIATFASAQPVASFSPTSLNFGTQQYGVASAPMTVTLTNTGNATMNIPKIQITGAAGSDYAQTNTCGTSLAAGANCVFTVILTPSWTGTRAGTLNVFDNAAGSPQMVTMTGTSLAPAVSFSPSSLAFPDQLISSSSTSQNITLKNTGTVPLNIASLVVAGTNPSDFSQTQTCGTSLAVSATCTITVTFTPTTSWGRTAAIWVTDNALGSPHVAGVFGNGVSGGVASFSPSTLTFTKTQLVGTLSTAQPVTLNNTGTAPLQIANITAAGDFTQTNNCGASVAPAGSCTINVIFAPTYSATRAGWLDVNFVDPGGVQTVALTGTGALSTPVLVAPKIASITTGQTLQYTATISGVQSTAVTWDVDNIRAGNTKVGTISAAGLYTPPSTPGTHKITAINNANNKQTASVSVVVSGYTGTFTHHNDNLRTGQNNNEPALTTGNVNQTQFAKLFSYPVDGQIYAEPLWVPNVNINGTGLHNVVFVATEHDSVYAFDADSAAVNPNPLWQASFINPSAGITSIPKADVEVGLDVSPEVGITSTPVIDPVAGIIYVEARTLVTAGTTLTYVHSLHALNISTGAEMTGSPITIAASVPGTGYDNVGGVVTFNNQRQNNRTALLLLNGVVYIAFASLEDINFYHGWILGYSYNSSTGLTQACVFNNTANGNRGGIWHGGGGIPADASGNLYVATGTGSFTTTTGGGISVTKLLPATNTLTLQDYFQPFNQAYLTVEAINLDISSGGPMLLPDQTGTGLTHLAAVAGKTGTLYMLNRDSLGQFNPNSDNVPQAFYTTIGGAVVPTGNWGTPAYFNGGLYIQGVKDVLKQFTISNSLLSGGPVAVGADVVGYPGTTPVISSNGTQNGIVWVVQSDGAATSKPSTLRAYDAADIAHELYNSGLAGNRDLAGPANKFATPTVANGKVYVPTASEVDVYGLLP